MIAPTIKSLLATEQLKRTDAAAALGITAQAMSNKYTKYSNLIGGIIIFLIGVLLLLKPEWIMFNFG